MSLLAPARGMPTLWPRQEVCKRWPQRPYLACLPLKLDGVSRSSLRPVPASSSNASEYASSAQGSKEAYPSSTLSAGSHRGLWDWDSAYSSHWKHLRLLAQPKTFPPAGQGMLRQHCIARRKSVFLFQGVSRIPVAGLGFHSQRVALTIQFIQINFIGA